MLGISSRFDAYRVPAVWTMMLFCGLAALAPQDASAQAAPAQKKESSVTVYGGYRFGGSLTETTTNSTIDLKDGGTVALAVDIGLDRQTQIQLFYSRQNTALTSGAFSSQGGNIGLTLNNFHFGGTYFIEEVGRGLYVVGGLGATSAKPDQSGLNSETFFSGNLGVGWMVPLGKHVGLRFEARGYGVMINGDSSLFCGNVVGCTVSIKGDALYMGEALVGLSIRF